MKTINTFLFVLILISGCKPNIDISQPIRPSADFPGYWEYKGEPVLLLGGTRNDNLFQEADAPDHLAELAEVGGNYIRNTMSARDSGDLQPFFRTESGLYDLNQWNNEYWQRFENMLQAADELNIIVQIEVWDRFDFSRDEWLFNAFNPSLNINYTFEETGLDSLYPLHPGADVQPFFHSVSGMPLYSTKLDLVREYQEKYVDKVLSYTFNHPNVLYCMNNETNTPVEWGQSWIRFINQKATEQNKEIYATDMFDANYRPRSCPSCLMAIENSEMYPFLDISQINSRNFGQAHWDTLQLIMNLVADYKRPVNSTKVYGSGFTGFGSGSPQDGVERFCRNIVGGLASARFHRPTSGNGLNDLAKATIKAVRLVETHIYFWEVAPSMDLLTERDENEAYLASNENDKYIVYFPTYGSVVVNTPDPDAEFDLFWIGVAPGNKTMTASVQSTGLLKLDTPDDGGWFAVLKRK
jgi:hypothetical protein